MINGAVSHVLHCPLAGSLTMSMRTALWHPWYIVSLATDHIHRRHLWRHDKILWTMVELVTCAAWQNGCLSEWRHRDMTSHSVGVASEHILFVIGSAVTVDLYDVLGNLGELIHKPLAVHLVEDPTGVVISGTHKVKSRLSHDAIKYTRLNQGQDVMQYKYTRLIQG